MLKTASTEVMFSLVTLAIHKGIGRKISRLEHRKKQGQKLAPLSLLLLYQYHVEKSPLPPLPMPMTILFYLTATGIYFIA